MDRLNINQLAILLDWPKDRCRFHFNKIEELPTFLYEENKSNRKHFPVSDNKVNREWFISIERIEAQVCIPITPLIEDVRANFTKNKACMDYVMKQLSSKVKPNKKTGFYPLKIAIPDEVGFLLTPEQRQIIIDRVPSYLPFDVNQVITKHSIRII